MATRTRHDTRVMRETEQSRNTDKASARLGAFSSVRRQRPHKRRRILVRLMSYREWQVDKRAVGLGGVGRHASMLAHVAAERQRVEASHGHST